jgi:uncharacterized protein with HEPN domain
MNERDKGRLIDIINFAQQAIDFVSLTSEAEFFDDRLTQRACERCVEVVGEAASQISQELVISRPDFPWKEVRGMRVILAHKYGGVDLGIIYSTVKEKLPELVAQVREILKDQENP